MKDRFSRSLLVALFLFFSSPASATEHIDILFVYDTTATAWVANNGGMEAFTLDAVNRMNQAAANSGLDVVFNAVHSTSVPYTTTSSPYVSLSGDLIRLTDGDTGLETVSYLRAEYGADLVTMLVDHGSAYGYTGVAWILNSYSGRPGNGFSVNAIRSVDISHTLTHEVGHNLGAGHSKNQAQGPGPGPLEPYAAGYYFTGSSATQYHTIMAYASDGYGNSYTSAPIFSSPLLVHDGAVAGNPYDGDNARLLSDTLPVVSTYLDGPSTPTPPPTPIPLAENDVVTGLSGESGSDRLYTVDVTSDVTSLSVSMSGGDGDADLYVLHGDYPTSGTYDCRPYIGGNNESCEFEQAQAGQYGILVHGFSSYSDVTLEVTASYSVRALSSRDLVDALSGASGSSREFYIDVPSAKERVTFSLLHGSGNADLYVRYGESATTSLNDCASEGIAVDEVCSFDQPPAGRYYVTVYGDDWYKDAALAVRVIGASTVLEHPSWGGWRSTLPQFR